MRVPACQCRLPEQERAAEERCCTLHRAGLKDSGREERSPPGMQRCWGSRRAHPLGSAPRSPVLPVIPGVFPKATLASLLFSGQPWVLLQHRLRRGGRCGRGGGTDKGEMRRGSGLQGPSLWAPSPSALGILRAEAYFPRRFEGNFVAALSASGASLALGEMVCVLRREDILLGSSLMKKREVLWVDSRLQKPNPPRRCF